MGNGLKLIIAALEARGAQLRNDARFHLKNGYKALAMKSLREAVEIDIILDGILAGRVVIHGGGK